ncbi:MAG: hypothetical protein IKB25_04985 [Lentisphaeria bacterium]|nr:hypothetical protein [Lentisphaeria bacterium]
MKFPQRLKIVIPVMLLAAVIAFAAWYVSEWYIPTGAIVPGAPIELQRLSQNDKEVKIITKKKGKTEQGLVFPPDGKPLLYKVDYKEKIFIEQTVLVNGIPVKGIYRNDQGVVLGYTVTFYTGEQREYTLSLQIDWQVEKHRFLDRYRGKAWKTNFSLR